MARMPKVDLRKVQTHQERAVLRAFRETIQSIQDQAVLSEVAHLIDVGDVEGVVDLLQLNPSTFRPLENSIRAAYEAGGDTGASQIGRIPTRAGSIARRFSLRNPRAEQFLTDLSSRKIVEIAEESRRVVRGVLSDGMSIGQGPRQTALDLVGRIDRTTRRRTGGYIGLTEQQADWSRSAREELKNLDSNYFTRKLRDKRFDGVIRRAIESGKPIDQETINRAIGRMRQRTLRYRAENIARTESLQALSEGQYEAIKQAVDDAGIDEQSVTKRWDATGDARTRPWHSQVERANPDGIPINEPFWVGGEMMQRPRQIGASASNVINCRCSLITRMDFAGRAAKEIEGFG